MRKSFFLLITYIFSFCLLGSKDIERVESFTNSIGMKFVRIESGSFMMGENTRPLHEKLWKNLSYPNKKELKQIFPFGDTNKFFINLEHVKNGDFDEIPVHKVIISESFYMSALEVTNEQYEKFDPAHNELRGKMGFSGEDDEAVIFISWEDANAFCNWLSEKEGLPYRLPTEAEWEYTCRAGTNTPYYTGDTLPKVFHKNARRTWFTEPEDIVPLTVGETPPNPWGLYDMHGNVEEWCYDWYGPYEDTTQVDPVGRETGDFKVTRGGSHGTNLYFLRSANRMATLPDNKHWLIGFRVVLSEMPNTKHLPDTSTQPYQKNVKQENPDYSTKSPDPDKPYFKGPLKYVNIPENSNGPLFSHHNHDPAIVECPNGDLLAIWYTCVEERGRELAIACNRLRFGEEEWEEASLFWDTPDRNDHCPALWNNNQGTIYHFNGLSIAGKWEPLAIIMRKSKDNGVTWSDARLIVSEHSFRQMVGEPVFRTKDGSIIFGADAESGSTIWVSHDNGKTWNDPGGKINGIHAGIAQLEDVRLMALGRGMNIDGWMPKSISADMGKSWEASPSSFPPITGGQRAVLIRLNEGPLFFASFAKSINNPKPVPEGKRPPRHVAKLFGALSFNEGKTWPVRRIISDCKVDHPAETIDGGPVLMNPESSEPLGYLSVCQGANGVIHLISSRNYYGFNLAWLQSNPPESTYMPKKQNLPSRKGLSYFYDASKAPTLSTPSWNFLTFGIEENQRVTFPSKGKMLIPKNKALKMRWSNERIGFFYKLDAHHGATAEIATKVISDNMNGRGLDFEVYIRGGTLTTNHYLITITKNAIYYWYDNKFRRIAGGLDNSSGVHNYRLAIRNDTAVQIYRDEKLLGVWPTDLIIDWRIPTRGSFIEWGQGSRECSAIIDYVTYDSLSYQP